MTGIPTMAEVHDGYYDLDDEAIVDDWEPWSEEDEARSWLDDDRRQERRGDRP